MNRFLLTLALALAALVATPAITSQRVAYADDPAPTPAQLEAAKKAFMEGKTLHDQGKLPEAIEKFKESYRLSKKPTLLYNIGVTMEEAGMEDLALFYYRKFLTDAPADAAQHDEVVGKVKALEKKFDPNAGKATPPEVKPEVKPDPEAHGNGTVKPAGTYKEKDFQHQVVEDAPPGKPLDVSAFVPEDSGWVVTLYFRGAGDPSFTAKPMKWHYKQLIARIPGSKVSGSSIQYYVEARDAGGKEVARAGKSTSPNLVNIDASAQAHFFPDFTDNTAGATGPAAVDVKHHDEEDPLHKSVTPVVPDQPAVPDQPVAPIDGNGGPTDVGSKKFEGLKWGTTAAAGTFLGLSLVFYLAAGSQASNLANDAKSCGTPPCRAFDSTDQSFQDAGHSRQTWSRVAFGAGIVATGVAAYFWYRELTKKPGEQPAPKPATGLDSMIIAPAIGDGFAGAAVAARF